jgi:DNA polymerase-3 subunit epsilon
LAEVYLELRGGRQPGLELASASTAKRTGPREGERKRRPPRAHTASDAEQDSHEEMLSRLKDPIWRR